MIIIKIICKLSQIIGGGFSWCILKKLRVWHAIILFAAEPGFIDERLDDWRKK